MNKVNTIVICRDEYKSKEEFENAIKDAVMILLNNNYIMTVRYDEKGLGIVAIDYNYDKEDLAMLTLIGLCPKSGIALFGITREKIVTSGKINKIGFYYEKMFKTVILQT